MFVLRTTRNVCRKVYYLSLMYVFIVMMTVERSECDEMNHPSLLPNSHVELIMLCSDLGSDSVASSFAEGHLLY